MGEMRNLEPQRCGTRAIACHSRYPRLDMGPTKTDGPVLSTIAPRRSSRRQPSPSRVLPAVTIRAGISLGPPAQVTEDVADKQFCRTDPANADIFCAIFSDENIS